MYTFYRKKLYSVWKFVRYVYLSTRKGIHLHRYIEFGVGGAYIEFGPGERNVS
jgi:hypothetical protein